MVLRDLAPRRRVLALAAVLGAALALPSSWEPSWGETYLSDSLWLAVLLSAPLLYGRRVHLEPPSVADAITRATAFDVHLGHALAATVHERSGRTLVTLTWYEATSRLLDSDHRVLATSGRNILVDGWTMSLDLEDGELARQLASDRIGGDLVLHASVDLTADPWATLGNGEVHLEHVEVDFASWRGVISKPRVPGINL